MTRSLALLFALAASSAVAEDRTDLPVAGFEGETYGEWTATGEAFGTGPAKGTLPGQMHVEGYQGERLVNSFRGGDDATGVLTSPAFTIERKRIDFLIGGGKWPGETCLDLLVGGEAVRTATGPNDRPGGSERLDRQGWDVTEFAGKTATLRIVDRRKGGWGHVNVDDITQTDRVRSTGPAAREIVVAKRYLHLPVKNGAAKRRMTFAVGGKTVREFEIELADGPPDFLAFADVSDFAGKTLSVGVDRLPDGSQGLAAIVASDEVPDAAGLYAEAGRPAFHFTSRRGWLNDPNGLVYADGEWHLFYQHNPYGVEWGNMHWGHAVSPDLFRWKELPEALYPKAFGDWAFSGSAVVDEKNTSGFGKGGKPPLVLAYTSTGRGECVAFSDDRGRTWTEYAGNPVVRHRGRDPKLIRHEPTRRWVMAVYDEENDGRFIAFYSSPDLKTWTFESKIAGFFECPDLFRLPVDDGKNKQPMWVLYGADGEYLLGDFDGKTFTPSAETPSPDRKRKTWYGNFYAAQTFDHAPEGRRVQIGWGRGVTFPGMPFNQQMTVPVELTLRPTADGVRLFAEPVREIETMRGEAVRRDGFDVRGETPLAVPDADALDLTVTFEPRDASAVGLTVRGVPVAFDAVRKELKVGDVTAPLVAAGGAVALRVLVDRGSVEVFADGGRVAVSAAARPQAGSPSHVSATGGTARVRSFVGYGLKSGWGE